jgi:ethanolamine utilization protein EutQ (cupin superfamily)
MRVRHFTSEDAKLFQYLDREMFVGDVLDSSTSGAMSVGFYRNKKKGEKNEWIVTYDEALIVTKGCSNHSFCRRRDDCQGRRGHFPDEGYGDRL